MAWRIPPLWNSLEEGTVSAPQGSSVLKEQKKQLLNTKAVLNSIAEDMRVGLLETVGVESSFSIVEGQCSIMLELPEKTDGEYFALAIDAENVEAWCDKTGKVHIGISPWYSTKDIDQAVLSAIKVIHVKLGIHATDSFAPKTLKQKVLSSIFDVMQIQKKSK